MLIRLFVFVFLICLVVATEPEIENDYVEGGKDFVYAAYLPEYRMNDEDWGMHASRTSDLILFSVETSQSGALTHTTRLAPHMDNARAAREDYDTNLIVSIGGGGRSKYFEQVTGNERTRKRLADNLAQYVVNNQLDGVDIDWEGRNSQQHTDNMLKLVDDLRNALASKFKAKSFILSVAVHPGDNTVVDIANNDNVDRVHLMAYDWCRSLPCKHSAYDATINSLKLLIDNGVPAKKLILGLPVYGRHMQEPDKALTYAEILVDHGPITDSSNEDADGEYFFNGRDMVVKKAKTAYELGCGGVFFWEAGQDYNKDTRSLLAAVRDWVHLDDVLTDEPAPRVLHTGVGEFKIEPVPMPADTVVDGKDEL